MLLAFSKKRTVMSSRLNSVLESRGKRENFFIFVVLVHVIDYGFESSLKRTQKSIPQLSQHHDHTLDDPMSTTPQQQTLPSTTPSQDNKTKRQHRGNSRRKLWRPV